MAEIKIIMDKDIPLEVNAFLPGTHTNFSQHLGWGKVNFPEGHETRQGD